MAKRLLSFRGELSAPNHRRNIGIIVDQELRQTDSRLNLKVRRTTVTYYKGLHGVRSNRLIDLPRWEEKENRHHEEESTAR